MASKKKKADRATAVPPEVMVTVDQKIERGRSLITKMQNSADWANAPDVQKRTGEWGQVMDDWEANRKARAPLLAKLATLDANDLVFARRFDTKKRAVAGSVTDFADGSRDVVHGFGWSVLGHDPLAPATTPTNLHDTHSKVKGTASVGWDTTYGKFQYQVQHATNTADPSTFSDPITTSRASFKLEGQTRGATIYFRVCALDPKLPNGKTDWSAWVPAQVG